MEGFFRISEEVKYMVEMGLFLDVVLIFNVEDSDVIVRFLFLKLDKWRVKRDKRLEKKRKKKEKV